MAHNIQLRDDSFQVKSVMRRVGANAGAVGERSNLADLLRLLDDAEDANSCAVAHPISIDAHVLAEMVVPLRRLHAGEMLFYEGAQVESIYFVRAGTFKTFRTAEDGYEQVLGFSGRAEVLGFDALCMHHHPNAAVALEDASVYSVQVRDLYTLGQRLPALDRVVHLAASRALARRGELADVMAAVAAEVRLARFLVQLSQRMAACGQSPYPIPSAHGPARHCQPPGRGARDRQPLLRRTRGLGPGERAQPRGRDPGAGGAQILCAQHARHAGGGPSSAGSPR